MTKTIQVTQEHINAGVPTCDTKCAVALALMKAYELEPEAYWRPASVDPSYIEIQKDGEWYRRKTPQKVQDFIRQFDKDKSQVEPFEFELDLL